MVHMVCIRETCGAREIHEFDCRSQHITQRQVFLYSYMSMQYHRTEKISVWHRRKTCSKLDFTSYLEATISNKKCVELIKKLSKSHMNSTIYIYNNIVTSDDEMLYDVIKMYVHTTND